MRITPCALKRYLKILLLLAVVALIAEGFGMFRRLQEHRLVVSAQTFFTHGDFRSASLSALEVLNLDPGSVPACELLERVAGNDRSPSAILWAEKLVEIEPGKAGRLLELARTAIRFGEVSVAEQALARVNERDRNTVAFHQTAGSVAIVSKQYSVADGHFQQALRIEPKNEELLADLATLRIGFGNPVEIADARAILDNLRKNSGVHREAVRALLADARRHGDSSRAMQLATELHSDSASTIDDQLLYLEELQHAKSPAFSAALAELQKNTCDKADSASAVMMWMNEHGLAGRSVEWSGTQPASITSQIPVSLALAEAYISLGDWVSLRKLVRQTDWGNLDFLRLAIYARVIDETASHVRVGTDFDMKWRRALGATHGDANAASMLARMVEQWGWKKEAAQAWWIAAYRSAAPRPALQSLYRLYSNEKDAAELYRVSRRIYEIYPDDPVAKNNVSSLALLLGQDLPEAHRLAEELFHKFPLQPEIVSTYAFSLYRQNRAKEAVAIMAKLPDMAFSNPSMAACYGVLLMSGGEPDKAGPFLKVAEQGKGQLFKEELALVEKARQPRQ